MWFKKDVVIPTVREASIRRVIGDNAFELEVGKMIRTQINALREEALAAIEVLIAHPQDSVEIPPVIFGELDVPDARYCSEAVSVVTAELEALGYVTFGEANGYTLDIAIPSPAAPATVSALRLVK